MEVLILLIFVSLSLAGAAVGLFVWLAGQRTFEHGDRLELLPLDEETPDQDDGARRSAREES